MTVAAAKKEMAPWKASFHWGGSGTRSAFWQFGISLVLDRPICVLEKKNELEYYDPVRIYGLKENGSLKRTAAKPGKAETIPSYHTVPIAQVLDMLKTPKTMSLVAFNGVNHFDPILYTPSEPRAKRQKTFATRFGIDDHAFSQPASAYFTPAVEVEDKEIIDTIPEGLAVGSLVWGHTLFAGQKKKYKGKVIAIRKAWPFLHVKWIEDENGNSNKAVLPEVASSYMMGKDVELI